MRLSRHLGTLAFSVGTGLWLLLSGQPFAAQTWSLPPHSVLSVQGDLSEEVYNALRPQMQEMFSDCQYSMDAITPSGQLIPHYFPATPTLWERLEDGTMLYRPLLGLLDLRPSGEGIASPGIYSLPAGEGFTAHVAHSMVCGRWPDGSRNSAVDPGAVAGCGFTGNCEGHVVIGENVYEYFGHPPYVRNDGDQWVLVFPRSHWLVDEIAVIVDGQLIFDPQPAIQSE